MAETTRPIAGLHHVTAIATDPRTNLGFYTRVLGLRLVKRTVNFDDPGTYHLYFGDATGTPGTILTFFPHPLARRGRRGVGQVTTTSFAVPGGSLGWWMERFDRHGVPHEDPGQRLEEEVLTFLDPDGLRLELVASAQTGPGEPWADSPVPAEAAVRGFSAVTLSERSYEATARLLTETLGFRPVAEEGHRFRFETGAGGPGAQIDLLCTPDAPHGHGAAGTVHHLALRAADAEDQKAWREVLVGRGLNPTPVLDRRYFESIYFREPGGVLFEIATDPPGFTFDETVEELGTGLRLPPWLEPRRRPIEDALPELEPAPAPV